VETCALPISYSVVVSNPYGSVTSDNAILSIARTSEITFNTSPQGLSIVLDGALYKAPITVTSVEGMLRTISVPSPQAAGEAVYYFSNWSHGGEQTQTIV